METSPDQSPRLSESRRKSQSPRNRNSPRNLAGIPNAPPPLPPTAPPSMPYDAYLANLEAQVRALESQKTELTAQLSSLRSSRALFSVSSSPAATPASTTSSASSSDATPITSALTDADLLSTSLAHSRAHSLHALESTYRLTGITSFLVRDPSPPNETLLGIRIERFSRGSFLAPHYLFLSTVPLGHGRDKSGGSGGGVGPRDGNREEGEEEEGRRTKTTLQLRHATIPPFLNLQALAKKYLPRDVPKEKQELEKLVREVRRRIVLFEKRGVALEKLRRKTDGRRVETGVGNEAYEVESSGDENAEDRREDGEREREREDAIGLGRPTSVTWDEAREIVEVVWEPQPARQGRVVGIIRLKDDGTVERSMVSQKDSGEREVRLKKVERLLRIRGLKVLERG